MPSRLGCSSVFEQRSQRALGGRDVAGAIRLGELGDGGEFVLELIVKSQCTADLARGCSGRTPCARVLAPAGQQHQDDEDRQADEDASSDDDVGRRCMPGVAAAAEAAAARPAGLVDQDADGCGCDHELRIRCSVSP